MKKIILIPPNGCIKKQDFLYDKLSSFFKKEGNYHVTLICLKHCEHISLKKIDRIIFVNNKNELLKKINEVGYDYLICRGWMHAYKFCADIVKKYEDALVIIKDWNFSTQDEYQFLFGNSSDFEAIEYLFKNAKRILSHYSDTQSELWSKEYQTNRSKFIFFPDYCAENDFQNKDLTISNNQTINLALAGTVLPSSYPEEFFVTKGLLRTAKVFKKQNISINIVIPPSYYRYMNDNKILFQDLFYENEFNDLFNVVKGETLNPKVLEKYDYGLFLLEYTTKNEYLNKYAVPSKFAFYLEAGIPIIVNSKMEALTNYVKKYDLGIVYNNTDLLDFRKLLDISHDEYKSKIDNIIKFRRSFLMDSNWMK